MHLISCSYRDSTFVNNDLVTGQQFSNISGSIQYVRKIGRAILSRRRRERQKDNGGIFQAFFKVRSKFESFLRNIPVEKRIQPRFIDWNDALIEHRYFFRSEEHTSELQSLMRISSAVFCLKKKKIQT